jgi:hypothetical protein
MENHNNNLLFGNLPKEIKEAMTQGLHRAQIVTFAGYPSRGKSQFLQHLFRKATGELDLFKEIFIERPHFSEISGRPLGDELNIRFFSHILTKGAYPSYRLDKRNIKLVHPEEHDTWEFGDRAKLRTLPEWQWVFERADQLKYEYYNPKNIF